MNATQAEALTARTLDDKKLRGKALSISIKEVGVIHCKIKNVTSTIDGRLILEINLKRVLLSHGLNIRLARITGLLITNEGKVELICQTGNNIEVESAEINSLLLTQMAPPIIRRCHFIFLFTNLF